MFHALLTLKFIFFKKTEFDLCGDFTQLLMNSYDQHDAIVFGTITNLLMDYCGSHHIIVFGQVLSEYK